jgi:hypothetical protein
MDKAFATNVRHEQNVKTCEKISSTCQVVTTTDTRLHRTRDVFKCVSETRQKLGMLLLGGNGRCCEHFESIGWNIERPAEVADDSNIH